MTKLEGTGRIREQGMEIYKGELMLRGTRTNRSKKGSRGRMNEKGKLEKMKLIVLL